MQMSKKSQLAKEKGFWVNKKRGWCQPNSRQTDGRGNAQRRNYSNMRRDVIPSSGTVFRLGLFLWRAHLRLLIHARTPNYTNWEKVKISKHAPKNYSKKWTIFMFN
jgi:hypothetical protein